MAGSRSEAEAAIKALGPPSGTTVDEWVAKAGQESGFRRDVVNRLGCVGYWQICPVNFGWLGVSQTELKGSARLQFSAVKRIYARQGWGAWAASGGKPDITDIAEHASHNVGLPNLEDITPGSLVQGALGSATSLLDPLTNALGPLGDIAGSLKGFLEWTTDPNTWKRVVLIVGGVVVIGVAAAALAGKTEAGQTVEAVVTSGATKGLVSTGGSK